MHISGCALDRRSFSHPQRPISSLPGMKNKFEFRQIRCKFKMLNHNLCSEFGMCTINPSRAFAEQMEGSDEVEGNVFRLETDKLSRPLKLIF